MEIRIWPERLKLAGDQNLGHELFSIKVCTQRLIEVRRKLKPCV